MKVAVIIAAYRAQDEWLEACIASVYLSAMAANLTGLDLRIGVDGCDSTAVALDEAGQFYWWSRANSGPYVMRNSLIALAPADAFVIFDADDVMTSWYFPTVLAALQEHALVGPSRIECDEQLRHIERKPYRHGVCAFRSEVLARLGGFKAVCMLGDVDFIARARIAGIVPYVTTEPCYLRRRHPASLTKAPETGRGSAAREQVRRRLERERLSAGARVYVDPVVTPLEPRLVRVIA